MTSTDAHVGVTPQQVGAAGIGCCAHPEFFCGLGLDEAYDVAKTLHTDKEDLIQKAVGWMLREAGKQDVLRLERYLRAEGRTIPRTTVRYAIERFPDAKRRALLEVTRRVRGQRSNGDGPQIGQRRDTGLH